MKYSSPLTSKGQAVIPKAVRDALRIKPGDRVSFRQEGAKIYLEAVLSAKEAAGCC